MSIPSIIGPMVQRSLCERLMGTDVYEQQTVTFKPQIHARGSCGPLITSSTFTRPLYYINEKRVSSEVFNAAVNGRQLKQTLPTKEIDATYRNTPNAWNDFEIPADLSWTSRRDFSKCNPDLQAFLTNYCKIKNDSDCQNIQDSQLRQTVDLCFEFDVNCRYEKRKKCGGFGMAVVVPVVAWLALNTLGFLTNRGLYMGDTCIAGVC